VCHGRRVCCGHQGHEQVGRTLLPKCNKHRPPPVSCILIGSVTKATAFTDNLNCSVVIIPLNSQFFSTSVFSTPSLLGPCFALFHRSPLTEITIITEVLFGNIQQSALMKEKNKCKNSRVVAHFCYFRLQNVSPLTFLNVEITTGFSFCMIIFLYSLD